MKIVSTLNGGVADVSDALAVRLIADGGWKSADAPDAPAVARKPRTKRAPVEEPKDEE